MARIVCVVLGLLLVQSGAFAQDALKAFGTRVAPVLAERCVECHGADKPKAKLDLSAKQSLEMLRSQEQQWFRVLERIEDGSMPPKGHTPLTEAEREAVAGWVRGEFTPLLIQQQRVEGRSKLRRLSRNEYANAVQDIFGIRPPVLRVMPVDGRVDGYDKVAGALPFSTAVTEGQMKIAEDIAARMFELPTDKAIFRLVAFPSEQSAGHILELPDGWKVSFNSDTTSGPMRHGPGPDGRKDSNGLRKPGLHRLRISTYAYQTDKPLPVGIYVGHIHAYPQILDLIKVIEVPPGKPAIVETEVYLRTGRDSDLGMTDGIRLIPLGLGVPVPKNTLAKNLGKGPGLALQWMDVEELDETLPGQRLVTAELAATTRTALVKNATLKNAGVSRDELRRDMQKSFRRIGARLFRRDLTEAELAAHVNRFLKEADAGTPLQSAFNSELVAMMMSPDFLCVIEKPGKLTNFALASRLSFFLWNSTPDEELLETARKGRLTDPQVLAAQTERLLNDSRSQRMVKDFTDQWLGLWGIDNTTPDKDLYPEYGEVLKLSSAMETPAAFRHMLEKNLSVRDFVAPKWAFINNRLASHYGFPGVDGFSLREVPLPEGTPFGGVWTHASTMKVTANGTLTSPVKRGVWVAERLLGTPIPPPPPDIGSIDPDTRGAKTLREQLALHASHGSCASCHARFDPFGFALESFDVMGKFRTHYRVADAGAGKGKPRWKDGLPVDARGVTPDGAAFDGIKELRELLAKNPDRLARGVTRHLITYATGQPVSPVDQQAIEVIVKNAAKDDYGLRSLLHGVVQSELFRNK